MMCRLSAARRAATLSFALLIAACGQQSTESDDSVALSVAVDPCVIALAPHVGSDAADRDIVRFQQRIADQTPPLAANYERLGWGYIAKARTSFDPGFYNLAEQTAQCMQRNYAGAAASLLQGHALHNLHRFSEAETLGRELVKLRGSWFDHALLGDALMEQGKLDEAAAAYQEMLNQRPGPQSYSRAAHLRWLTGDLHGAIEMMEKSVRATSLRNREAAAWARVQLALYALQAGDFAQTSRLVSVALGLQPDYAPALLARAYLLLAQGEMAAAVEVLRQASALNPLPEYQWALIEALDANGQSQQAAAIRTRLMQRGASDDARTFALYLATHNLATRNENVETALRLAEAELRSRQDPLTLDTLAWSLYAAGRIDRAYEFSQRALAYDTADARLFYHAGVIAAAAKQPAQARHWLSRATAIQQMLLPSERARLNKEFAALQSQIPTFAATDVPVSNPPTQPRRSSL